MNFIKLKNQFFFTQHDIVEQDIIVSINGGGFKNYKIDTSNPKVQKLYDLIPPYAHSRFSLSAISISDDMVLPHTDDIATSILFFISTCGHKTQFYKLNTDNPTKDYVHMEANQQVINNVGHRPWTYKTEELVEDGYYIANVNDAYCVNGWQPHAVIPQRKQSLPQTRSMILLGTDLVFAEVVNLLKITNSI